MYVSRGQGFDGLIRTTSSLDQVTGESLLLAVWWRATARPPVIYASPRIPNLCSSYHLRLHIRSWMTVILLFTQRLARFRSNRAYRYSYLSVTENEYWNRHGFWAFINCGCNPECDHKFNNPIARLIFMSSEPITERYDRVYDVNRRISFGASRKFIHDVHVHELSVFAEGLFAKTKKMHKTAYSYVCMYLFAQETVEFESRGKYHNASTYAYNMYPANRCFCLLRESRDIIFHV